MTHFQKLALSLALFIAALALVRLFDTTRYALSEDGITCPPGEVLVLDMRREFVCIPGSEPRRKN